MSSDSSDDEPIANSLPARRKLLASDRVVAFADGADDALADAVAAAAATGELCVLLNVDLQRLRPRLAARGAKPPAVIDGATAAKARGALYRGVVAASSWALCADALSNTLDVARVTRVVVGECEHVDAAGGFFLRLFAERRTGSSRLDAFAGCPVALAREPGAVAAHLCARAAAGAAAPRRAKVFVARVAPSAGQRACEAALEEAAAICARDVARTCAHLAGDRPWPAGEWGEFFLGDVSHALRDGRSAFRHSAAERHLRTLRGMRRLGATLTTDSAFAFLRAVEEVKRQGLQAEDPPPWLGSDAFEALTANARRRCADGERPPKWGALADLLRRFSSCASVAILCADEESRRAVASVLTKGADRALASLQRQHAVASAASLPKDPARDLPHQAALRAELENALAAPDDDLVVALERSRESVESDALKAAIDASLEAASKRRSSVDCEDLARAVALSKRRSSVRDPALAAALAASLEDGDDGGLQRALALSAAEAGGEVEVVDLLTPPSPRPQVVDLRSPEDLRESAPEDLRSPAAPPLPPARRPRRVAVFARRDLPALEGFRPALVVVYDGARDLWAAARALRAARPATKLARVLFAEDSLEARARRETRAREAAAFRALAEPRAPPPRPAPPPAGAPGVVVDARELRSGLPRALHERGVAVSVETLAVGDYVLSRRHAVERKNVDTGDLDSSLESGRLWTQLRSLEHHYANPLLLLEFERKTRPLSLRPLPDSLHARHPVAKLAKCVLEYPNARLLWSPSAADTPALFAALAGGGDVDVAGARALKDEQDFHRRALEKLPGVAKAPAAKRAFLFESDLCLADLATLTQDELGALLGPEAAAELAAFLDRDLRGGLREHEANVVDGERPPKRPRKRR